MGLTLTVKKWKETRPSSAKDSGVAEAIAGTLKDCSKPVASMTVDQVAAALTAVNALDKGRQTALEEDGVRQGQGRRQGHAADQGLAYRVRRLPAGTRRPQLQNQGRLGVEQIQRDIATAKKDFDEAYAGRAKAARLSVASGKAAPLDKVILNWMGQVRTMSAMTSKGFVPKMDGIPEAKLVEARGMRRCPRE